MDGEEGPLVERLGEGVALSRELGQIL
jgi:hypothetical protein